MEFIQEKTTFKKILPFIISLIIILGLLTLGYFFDLDISKAVVRLDNGNYYSSAPIPVFFEIVGVHPLYIMVAIGVGFIINFVKKFKKKGLRIVSIIILSIVVFLAYVLTIKRMIRYICENNGSAFYVDKKMLVYLISILSGLVCGALTIFLTSKVKDENVNKMAIWGLIVVGTALLSQGIVQLVKPLLGRLRYRAMYVLEYNGYPEQAIFQRFLHFNGKGTLTEEMINLGMDKDIFKSCPSGHSSSSTMVLCLGLIPSILGLKNKKYLLWNSLIWSVSVIYVIFLSYTRIVVGAHFLTDVTLGVAITYLSMVLVFFIIKKVLAKHYEKSNNTSN